MNNFERSLIESDLLRSFLAIAKCGNLTRASGHLGRTQSAISVQLRRLEETLGVSLFERSSKGMVLTPAGRTLMPRASAILSELLETSRLFSNPLSGSIRIGIPDDYDTDVLERILMGFSQAHPDVNVKATSGCTSTFPSAIRDGVLDVAVYSGPENNAGETLEISRPVWVVKSGHKLDAEMPVPLAILERSCWWRDLPTRSLDKSGRDYVVSFTSSSFASLSSAIRCGFAIGVMPERSLSDEFQVLSVADGFPELPQSRRSIVFSETAPQAISQAMAEAIKNATFEDVV